MAPIKRVETRTNLLGEGAQLSRQRFEFGRLSQHHFGLLKVLLSSANSVADPFASVGEFGDRQSSGLVRVLQSAQCLLLRVE